MSEETLYKFYLSLIPNLFKELYFFIPEKEIRPDVIEKLDFLNEYNFLNKVLVFDEYQGPIHYEKGRSNKQLLLKESDLEMNIFKLLEKKSEGKVHEFNYVLNKYFEFVETMFNMINWMYYNPTQTIKSDSNLAGIFYIQFTSYKNHFEAILKTFCESKETIPKGNFNAHDIVETYFPDVVVSFKQKNNLDISSFIVDKSSKNLKTTSKRTTTILPLQDKKVNKVLIKEAEAEKKLLQTFFNISGR